MAPKDVPVKNDPMALVAVSAEPHGIGETRACAARGQAGPVKGWRALDVWLSSCAVLAAGVAGGVMLFAPRFAVGAGALSLLAAMLITLVGPARRESRAAEAARSCQTVEMSSCGLFLVLACRRRGEEPVRHAGIAPCGPAGGHEGE
jgi:hypothetical protein